MSVGCLTMGWLRLIGSFKLYVSSAEYRLFYRALLQKRPMILRSLLVEATPYVVDTWDIYTKVRAIRVVPFAVWCACGQYVENVCQWAIAARDSTVQIAYELQ